MRPSPPVTRTQSAKKYPSRATFTLTQGCNGSYTHIARRRLCDAKTQITIPGAQPPPSLLKLVGGLPTPKGARCNWPFALLPALDYDSLLHTTSTVSLSCDGCGQSASPEHIARRLQRLEWSTRYRPVHIGTLLLGGVSPTEDGDFLYAGNFKGEAGRLLDAVGASTAGKAAEWVLSEFQRGGFFLTYVLECPMEIGGSASLLSEGLIQKRIPAMITRIRRSLKPKRVLLISDMLAPFAETFSGADLGCPLILQDGKPFALDSGAAMRLRESAAPSGSVR